MGNAGSTSEPSAWTETYNAIKTKHDAAYQVIQAAINSEEQERPDLALDRYKEGIRLIDEALRVQVTCPEHPDFKWEKACVMIQKMKKTRAEVLMRINSIQKSNEAAMPAEGPPSYEEAVASPSTSAPQTYSDLANALSHMRLDPNLQMEAEVIYIYEGVKLYFISEGGEVSSTLSPQTLKITLLENEGENVPRAILQIGDWMYPLIPGVSPCYRAEFGAFILPNVYVDTPGASIGIILPPDADASAYELLESVLYGIVGENKAILSHQEELMSEKISSGIVAGATYLSKGLVFGAEKIGGLIHKTTPKLINNIESSEEPARIPPRVTKGMQMAESCTNKAVEVTGFVAEQVGIATMKLGRFLAPHIKKQGTRLLTSGFKMSEEEATAKVQGVMTVAAGAVEGFSTVYHGLENSAVILGRSIKDNTVKVVHHKYGQPAGEFAGDTLNTVGNVYYINQNTKIIRPTHFATKTVKEAGKAVIYNSSSNRVNRGASTSNFPHSPPGNGVSDISKNEKN